MPAVSALPLTHSLPLTAADDFAVVRPDAAERESADAAVVAAASTKAAACAAAIAAAALPRAGASFIEAPTMNAKASRFASACARTTPATEHSSVNASAA